jgi:thiamine biosynthesis lipoprotein
MKKIGIVLLLLWLVTGCSDQKKPVEPKKTENTSEVTKYSEQFFDTFDTMITFTAYTETREEYDRYSALMKEEFYRLHRLYDMYHLYDGVNNLRVLNESAGGEPVSVDTDLLNLLIFSKEWYGKSEGKLNVALGAALELWHDAREAGLADPEKAALPSVDALKEAANHAKIEDVIIDKETSTVRLVDPEMKLDLGAVAKGYATEIVAKKLAAAGMDSGIINAGGNIRTIGEPVDGLRDKWSLGIENPGLDNGEPLVETVFFKEGSLVTSGDYQRVYTVDGTRYHHLIDPDTLMPANFFRSVTIWAADSGLADALSTTLFLMSYEEGRALVDRTEGVEVLWVFPDGEIRATEGMEAMRKSRGATPKD